METKKKRGSLQKSKTHYRHHRKNVNKVLFFECMTKLLFLNLRIIGKIQLIGFKEIQNALQENLIAENITLGRQKFKENY